MRYQVRAARITDIDRLVTLADGELGSDVLGGAVAASDLLRQLVYLPQASVLIAESREGIAGGAVLALRPSVSSGGYVGTIDLLVVDKRQDAAGVLDALLEELLRSAGNKGCSLVEAPRPDDPPTLDQWQRRGFVESGPRIEHAVAAARATARHS